jgi:tryptophan-rich sensory protein
MESYNWWQDISKRHAVGCAGTKVKMIWIAVFILLVVAASFVWSSYRLLAVTLLGIWCLQLLFSLRWAMIRLQKHEQDLS